MPNIILDQWIDLGVRGCRSITVTQRRTVPGFFDMTVPVAYWTMDEPAGSIRADSVGSNDLSEFTGNVPTTPGIINDAAILSSSGGMDRNGVSGLWTYASGITMAGWFKFTRTTLSDPSNNGTCGFGMFGSGGFGEVFRLAALSDGLLYAEAKTTIGFTSRALFSGVVHNQFLFIRMWVDPADNLVHCKINEGATQDGVGTLTPSNFPTFNIQFTGKPVHDVGNEVHIDEVGIYGTVLTDQDGAFLYNSGAGQRPPFS